MLYQKIQMVYQVNWITVPIDWMLYQKDVIRKPKLWLSHQKLRLKELLY